MFDQRIDSEPIPKPSTGDIDGLQPIPIPNQEPSLITQESAPVAHQEADLEILLRALIQTSRHGDRESWITEVDKFGEEPLEAGRGDDLQYPRRSITGVPEGVPLVAGLEDQIAGAGDQHLLAQQRADASLQDIAVFVLACVPV